MLTGCDAKMILLAEASRGAGRKALWANMERWHLNGYILGGGTQDANIADQTLQDSGLVFDAAYCIFRVLQVRP